MPRRFGSFPAFNGSPAVLSTDARLTRPTTRATVDFACYEGDEDSATTTFVAATWVTGQSIITCLPAVTGSPDHSAEDAAVEFVEAYVTSISPGVGFEITATAPNGTWGRYDFDCLG